MRWEPQGLPGEHYADAESLLKATEEREMVELSPRARRLDKFRPAEANRRADVLRDSSGARVAT